MTEQLDQLLANLDDRHREFLCAVALEVARIQATKWTGQTTIVINSKDGTCAEVELQTRSSFWRTAGRRMRSSGI